MKTGYIIFLFSLACSQIINAGEPLRLTADDCSRLAVENSRKITRQELALRQAELDRKLADISRLPNLQGMATGMYMLPDMEMMGMKMEMHGAYMAGLQITQPVYTGGKITAGRRLAQIGKNVAEQQSRMDKMDVMTEALHSYWTYVAVLDKVKLTQSYFAMMDTLYQQTATAVDAGLATENDLLRVSAKRSEIVYQHKKAQNGAELCRLALCNAIGMDFNSEIVPADSVPVCNMIGTDDVDISSLPELALLRGKVEASKQQVKLTLGDFLPTLGLSLGYNWYGNIRMKGYADAGGGMMVPYTMSMKDNFGMAMLALQVPIFHWGEGSRKVKKARLEVERSQLELDETSQLLELRARQAASNLDDGTTLVATAKDALGQAEENLRVMRNRYEEGMSTLTDLLDAQTQWQQAHSDMIEAVTQFQIYKTDWLRAVGRLGDL